ncbi:DNA mismatch repair protein MutS [Dehalogenimonas formicexedens]|uniref:DNA mismatch repair protein MutS n=1 Tax=Dehalogenimonas formicexedens TaxID=1839801 RepID=A0A1P8F6C2_9CHLR|nr:DNA mismatch repair protein MutS [Dehalogenimonas formicexedens]APV43892.1 DNA mismatch repair protein MutS [Dehalogenimonas formicexedens]
MAENLTPLRSQYLRIKQRYPDVIVFFRLGDFYETFDTDAEVTARELEIVLTAREMGKGMKVPMAGIPYHAVDNYLARLINRGHKVAICEQTTRPGDTKGLMEREVVRLVTPGTVVEPGLLDLKTNNYLAAVFPGDGQFGLAYVDISTGQFAATQMPADRIQSEIERLAPAEIIVPRGSGFTSSYPAPVSELDAYKFEVGAAADLLKDHFGVATLEGYGIGRWPPAISAAGAVVAYLKDTNKDASSGLSHLSAYSVADYMALDENTVNNLEIFKNATTGAVAGSLLGVLDATRTPMGARLLRRWLGQPLLDSKQIVQRHQIVEAILSNNAAREEISRWLKPVADIERLANRIRNFAALPRELIALKRSLEAVPELARALHGHALEGLKCELRENPEIIALIEKSIEPEPASAPGEGGVIREGFSADLDRIKGLTTNTKSYIAKLETEERAATGIKNLKVGYNQVFGYYLEVSQANLAQVPDRFIRKQTLANAERYVTPELKEYEAQILSSKERLAEIETSLYRQVLGQIGQSAEAILALADAVARLDVFAAFAASAAANSYVKPEVKDIGPLVIAAGRHPVVELCVGPGNFISNDLALDSSDSQLIILTGPNMAGKSTYLKQTAIIVLMAQVGSFVPAARAEIGICDRIFTRIGAREDLASGQSTFMVEMVETAAILSSATSRSLLILDEIGRGTSTYDGLAIARAVVEYIHDRIGARTLFATHYHELVELAEKLPRVRNFNVAVAEDRGNVVFLHRIQTGGVDRSYGIHVAKLAGLPKSIINRANRILLELETAGITSPPGKVTRIEETPQLSFLGRPPKVVDEIKKLDPDTLTPREALDRLYEIKRLADQS